LNPFLFFGSSGSRAKIVKAQNSFPLLL